MQQILPVLSVFQPEGFNAGTIVGLAVILLLLIISALVSGSEVAFFSLSPTDLDVLKNLKSRLSRNVTYLLKHPERLLATILIANNFVNVGIVIISTYITSQLFYFDQNPVLGFIVQVVVITFLILFISEVFPKVYSNRFARSAALFASPAMLFFTRLFWPISSVLIRSTGIVNRKLAKKKLNISIDDLSDAIDLTEVSLTDEKTILKGIVKFGNIYVSEIMQSRMDVIAVDINTSFDNLLKIINESGYSRIPVYKDSFDDVKGILYIKDLLPHLEKQTNFRWQGLIRPSYFVPESKKINDLLKEFQLKHIHMAVVVDEYGGTSGIVTLEDILEEIVGEISDESDEDDLPYKVIDNNNILFEGKVLLNDFYKVTAADDNVFDEIKGEADTLAGLILELRGEIPRIKDKLSYKQFVFEIKEVDKRRIKQILVTIKRDDDDEN
ncbi:MAG: gliding motility-associated protein GldE [Bacteroidales bacterium]|nr:gliding motility-associated protein GldE [Bacteroidales bacterium]